MASGALKYVIIGHGTKRTRRMFTDADLNQFVVDQTRKDIATCPSTSPHVRHTGTSTSKCEVIGFTARRNARRAAKPKNRSRRAGKAKRLVAQLAAAKTSLKLDDVADRWWSEVGQHHAGANNTEHELALLIEFFGKDKLLPEITGDDVARLGAWRRGHRRKDGALISPHTVNHTMKQLRKLFTSDELWGVRFEHEPRWSKYLLAVPDERVRELSDDEADRLDAVMRDDLAPFFAFALASGLRLAECLLRWSEVDWSAQQIRKPGKGGKRIVSVPITPTIREILWPLRGHHPDCVFTVCCRSQRLMAVA